MGYTATAIPANEAAAFAADRPVLLGSHFQRDQFVPGTTFAKWSSGAAWAGSPDETASGFPVRHASDGFATSSASAGSSAHLRRFTSGDASKTTWYYHMAPALTSEGFADPFDTICLWGENLDTATTITIDISDVDTYAAFTTIGTLTPATRMMGFFPFTYSGVLYMRIKIDSAGIFPRINQLWIGRRRQLLYNVNLPLGNLHEVSRVRAPETSVGVSPPRTVRRNGAKRNVDISTGSVAELAPLQDWWVDARHGSRNFIWIEDPTSNPLQYIMTMANGSAEFDAAIVGPYRRDLRLSMVESAPYRALVYP